MSTVAAALRAARSLGIASLDAQVLLARLLGLTRTGIIANEDRPLSLRQQVQWAAWLDRRAAGEPVAYLLGEKEFHGLTLAVTRDVLVPRPETELIVDWALAVLAAAPSDSPTVLDLGTGSGAIALAIKHRHPAAVVVASDASSAALAVARRNGTLLDLEIEWVESSWWQGLASRRFDLVVANPPYIAAADPHLAALHHEPPDALTPGGDGLGAIEAITAGARAHLSDGAWLVLEHGFNQDVAVRSLLHNAGLADVETRADVAGRPRATGGRRG